MSADPDRYEAYYADKLWALLPEIYRASDSDDPDRRGPLREIVERVGAQAAILRRSIDRTWEDQSIETCDDWVVAYLGDLLATNLVGSLDARSQRLDVAKTIYYRRRKGTPALLEEMASDITGWDARVVEMFRRLGRARHRLDPAIGLREPPIVAELAAAERLVGLLSRTPAGGFADLRSPRAAALNRTAFDEFSYTGDVRAGRGVVGWHNIPKLAVFVWRLKSVAVHGVTPVRDAACPNRFSFDPTGRRIPLFCASTRVYGDTWVSPAEHQVPGPMSRGLLETMLASLYGHVDPLDAAARSSVGLYDGTRAENDLIPLSEVTGNPHENKPDPVTFAPGKTCIDPEQGLFYAPEAPLAPPSLADAPPTLPSYLGAYYYGFSSHIGAGGYDRGAPANGSSPVSGGGAALATRLAATSPDAEIILGDSLTYTSISSVAVGTLSIVAANTERPLVRLPKPPRAAAPTAWSFTGNPAANGGAGSRLLLDGVFLSGGDILISKHFDEVTLRSCTLDPGSLDPETGKTARAIDLALLAPCRLRIAGSVRRLVIDRSVLGPIQIEAKGAVEIVTIQESIVQAIGAGGAISIPSGRVEIIRSTILGSSKIHSLEADTSILDGVTTVIDLQHGCVRFSAWTSGSAIPRPYESVEIAPRAAIFASRRFDDPGFAQLLPGAGGKILEGAEDGSEMGAFWREQGAIKEHSLLVKYEEYMPIGLTPAIFHAT